MKSKKGKALITCEVCNSVVDKKKLSEKIVKKLKKLKGLEGENRILKNRLNNVIDMLENEKKNNSARRSEYGQRIKDLEYEVARLMAQSNDRGKIISYTEQLRLVFVLSNKMEIGTNEKVSDLLDWFKSDDAKRFYTFYTNDDGVAERGPIEERIIEKRSTEFEDKLYKSLNGVHDFIKEYVDLKDTSILRGVIHILFSHIFDIVFQDKNPPFKNPFDRYIPENLKDLWIDNDMDLIVNNFYKNKEGGSGV